MNPDVKLPPTKVTVFPFVALLNSKSPNAAPASGTVTV
jgi:hypothetical protein